MPQTAFIYGASVRDNILFGLPYEEGRYHAAIEASALAPDLEQLPSMIPVFFAHNAHFSEIGNEGSNT